MVLWCQKQQNVGQDAWCNTLQRCLEDQNPEEQDVVIDYQILEELVQARLPHHLIQIQRSWVSQKWEPQESERKQLLLEQN